MTNQRPDEINDFWNEAYPEIDTIANKVAVMQDAGYIPIPTFVLPQSCWLDDFYGPQSPSRKTFMEKYPGNLAAKEFMASQRHEELMYNKYKEYYGYVFYIGKKI